MSEGEPSPEFKVEGERASNGGEAPSEMKDLQDFLVGGSLVREASSLYLSDPFAFLPANSDSLVAAPHGIRAIFTEIEHLIEDELRETERPQKQIALWEERIRKNSALIHSNLEKSKQNIADMVCDDKSREFWSARAAQVLADYAHAEASGSLSDWTWLIKKYGLKNQDGFLLDPKSGGVDQLCHKAASILAAEYRMAGVRYEHTRKQKEAENALLLSDNEKLAAMNEQLQKYILNVYSSEVEPLQDGVLLFKELVMKLKTLERQERPATYGELRAWAETFLDQFLRANSAIPNRVVVAFRRLASIPLPAQNS